MVGALDDVVSKVLLKLVSQAESVEDIDDTQLT
jgi:hypothetical protein